MDCVKTVYRNLENRVTKRIEQTALYIEKGELINRIMKMTIEHADPIVIGLDI